MTVSRQPQITEELLSAYLDDQVTAEERALVEATIATDPAMAWQVDSLRQTVHLLQALPPLALPRTFTLEAILAQARTAEAPEVLQPEVVIPTNPAPSRPLARTLVAEEPETSWWQWFLQLWQGGNLQLRNAAAVALTLFFVLFAGDRFLVTTRPLVEVTPAAAPVALTSEPVVVTSAERAAIEPPVAPATAEPTATNAPATLVATTVVNSDSLATGSTPNNATTANTLADPAVQPENSSRRSEGATFAAPSGVPGPVEETLNPDGAASGDVSAAQSLRATGSGERDMMAKSTAPVSNAAAANTVGTQPYSLAATLLTTTTVLTAPVSALMTNTVTNTNAISVTLAVTPMVTITQTAVPTVTMVSAASLVTATPTGNEDIAWLTWLTWAQVITALSTMVLAGLWWRSRR